MVRINSVKFGEVEINGKTYYSDMVVWWDGKREYREKKHVFDMDDYLSLMKRKPRAIVIGTGQHGAVKIREEVLLEAGDDGVDIFMEVSQKAIEIFNGLALGKKRVVAVIHTTC